MRRHPLLILFALLACLLATPSFVRAQDPPGKLTAVVVSDFESHGDLAMHMPTDVAVGRDNSIFVADGVSDRIIVFPAGGGAPREIRNVGDLRWSRPVGLTVDAEGRLWIADSGHSRIIVCETNFASARVIALPAGNNSEATDPTDVVLTKDGAAAWVADNDGHRLFRIDVKSGVVERFGRHGDSLGQFDYPFMLAVGANDSILVSDVINGRIGVLNRDGQSLRAIGEFGIELGQLYRPKGVVTDSSGRVWVSDGVLGVIQAFTADGTVIDVLRDESGKVMPFNVPMGLAFDANGQLLVTELGANRVRMLRIIDRSTGPAPIPTRRPRASVIGRQARSCTICHIEFMEPFASGRATALRDAPVAKPGEPVVSQSEMCLSCHDGSVGDSRWRVWEKHGHRTGITPPGVMPVPDALPLVEGKIACRTCHSAHVGGQFTGNIATTVFLRMENSASQLCMSCHQDHTRGPTLGTHPTGGMPWAVPKELIEAGAKVGPNPREITCQVCHTPHGASYDHLLVMGVESNQLCLTCHAQMRPGMFRDDAHTEHPLSAMVNAEQKAAVQEMNTRLGPNDELICLSCHKLHHGKGDRFLLARELRDGQMCIQCHSEKVPMLGSSHDLRVNFPAEKNRLNMTPESGGPCSACHMFHRYARAPEYHPLDTQGRCITCHQEGRVAATHVLGDLNHADITCTECHNPHETGFDHYLKAQPAEICVSCHADQAGLAGGKHDYCSRQAPWPAASQTANDACLACHRPHAREGDTLLRVAPTDYWSDSACIACHSDAAGTSASSHALAHPRAAVTTPTGLPLVSIDAAHTKGVGCKTCHNPHAATDSLLRKNPNEPASSLCIQCHSPMQQILLTAHAKAVTEHGTSDDSCRACHSMHAEPGSLLTNLLNAAPLPAGVVAGPNDDLSCLPCHRAGGEARPPAIASHPDVPMFALGEGEAEASLPLYDERGNPSSQGRITCRTCHLPHGQQADVETVNFATSLSEPTRSQMRLMLRPFNPPNVCTTCHGADGLWRFLYYHDTSRRAAVEAGQPFGLIDIP